VRASHSFRLKAAKGLKKNKAVKALPEAKQKSLQAMLTTSNLGKLLSQVNVTEDDIDDIFADPEGDLEDTVANEESDCEDLTVDHEETDDDYTDYDEDASFDPFDIENGGVRQSAGYVVGVFPDGENFTVKFLKAPMFDTGDVLIKSALFKRHVLFAVIASFIAVRQKEYFFSLNAEKLVNLNQEDLVRQMRKKNNLSKEHISRMLEALFFRIDGLGYLPAKYFFKRYGHKTGLSQPEKLRLAVKFLATCVKKCTLLDKAVRFREFIKAETGCEIELSKNEDMNNRYRHLKNIIKRAETVKK
jgi:hypothetical protein